MVLPKWSAMRLVPQWPMPDSCIVPRDQVIEMCQFWNDYAERSAANKLMNEIEETAASLMDQLVGLRKRAIDLEDSLYGPCPSI